MNRQPITPTVYLDAAALRDLASLARHLGHQTRSSLVRAVLRIAANQIAKQFPSR